MNVKETYKTIERQGNVVILTEMTNANVKPRVRKLSRDEYLNVVTGEVCEYEHKENRAENPNSLHRTFATIRGIINTNATDPRCVRFLTFTYAENMTDPKRLYHDFKCFWGRLMTYHKQKEFEKPLYLLVVEPQERGAWHGHVLLFYKRRAPFLPKDDIERVWRHGFVTVQAVDNVDNVGAYLSAYLADVVKDLTEAEEEELSGIEDKEELEARGVKVIDGKKKAVIKGGRLHMYPPGMNIYRCSRALKRPKKYRISSSTADKYRATHKPRYSAQYTFKNASTGFETVIFKSWYQEPTRYQKAARKTATARSNAGVRAVEDGQSVDRRAEPNVPYSPRPPALAS